MMGALLFIVTSKNYKKGKVLILASIATYFLVWVISARYGLVPYGKGILTNFVLGCILRIAFLMIKPKWHIDSSKKLVMDKIGKETQQKKNEQVLLNIQETPEEWMNTKIMLAILIYVCVLLIEVVISTYFILPSNNSVKRNEEIAQVIANKEHIIKDDKGRAIGYAQKGDYLDILDEERSLELIGMNMVHVKNAKGIKGYIKVDESEIQISKNDPLYGKEQTNDRDLSKLQIKILSDYLSMYENVKTTKEVGKVKQGEIYTVLDQMQVANYETWYKINTTYGVTGWIEGCYAMGDNIIHNVQVLKPNK